MTTTTPATTTPIALVTGGSRGLGRATALALADAAVDVVVTYLNSADEAAEVVAAVEAKGRRGVALRLDTGEPGSFAAFRDAFAATLPGGRFDILVNNACTALCRPLQEVTVEELDRVFAVHVKGPLFLTQALEPLLRDGGRIVNISSALTRMAFPGSGPYAAAKGAIEVLTRYQALEYGGRGITVNVVAAGAVPTDFGGGHLRSDPQLQQVMIDSTALKRLATPDDIGAAVAGLVTASGSWITGQRIEAAGGVRL